VAVVLTPLPDGVAARAHRATEPLHAMVYFAPETEAHLTAAGLRPGRMCYFAARSAAMGAVSPGVTAATFYNFNPELVARHLPRAWSLAAPAAVVAAFYAAADEVMVRLLGPSVLGSADVAEAADLAREATVGLDPAGRPLYAGLADLAWPEAPHLVLFHAASLLREHRGDGHIAALQGAGLSGIEAIVTHTATGRGFTEPAAKALRGWSEEQWAGAVRALQDAGLLDAQGLTAAGRELRQRIEAATDAMAAAPWARLGPERTQRLTEIAGGLSRTVKARGAFPDNVFAAASSAG